MSLSYKQVSYDEREVMGCMVHITKSTSMDVCGKNCHGILTNFVDCLIISQYAIKISITVYTNNNIFNRDIH